MSSKKRETALFLFDLYSAVVKIEEYVAPVSDAATLKYDFKTWDAVMHEFTVMGEAAKHLVKEGWLPSEDRVVVDFRNIIVHHYFGLDAEDVWHTIQHAMPPFKNRIENLIASLDPVIRQKWIEVYLQDPLPGSVEKAFKKLIE